MLQLALFLLGLGLSTLANAQCMTPTLTSLSPGSSSITGGANFTIIGQNFCPGSIIVDFGSMQATLTVQTETQITGKIPANAPGPVPVTITNTGANPVSFVTPFLYIAPAGGLVASAGPALFGATGQTLTFFGYVAGGIPPYTFYWNFGDGSSGNAKNGAHIYQTAKVYPVTFLVFDAQNYMSFSTTTAYVSGPITNFLRDNNGQLLTDGTGGKLLAQ